MGCSWFSTGKSQYRPNLGPAEPDWSWSSYMCYKFRQYFLNSKVPSWTGISLFYLIVWFPKRLPGSTWPPKDQSDMLTKVFYPLIWKEASSSLLYSSLSLNGEGNLERVCHHMQGSNRMSLAYGDKPWHPKISDICHAQCLSNILVSLGEFLE